MDTTLTPARVLRAFRHAGRIYCPASGGDPVWIDLPYDLAWQLAALNKVELVAPPPGLSVGTAAALSVPDVRVRVVKPFLIMGQIQAAGAEITLKQSFARDMERNGRVVRLDVPADAPPASPPPATPHHTPKKGVHHHA